MPDVYRQMISPGKVALSLLMRSLATRLSLRTKGPLGRWTWYSQAASVVSEMLWRPLGTGLAGLCCRFMLEGERGESVKRRWEL